MLGSGHAEYDGGVCEDEALNERVSDCSFALEAGHEQFANSPPFMLRPQIFVHLLCLFLGRGGLLFAQAADSVLTDVFPPSPAPTFCEQVSEFVVSRQFAPNHRIPSRRDTALLVRGP